MRLARYNLWKRQVRTLALLGLTFGCLTANALTTPSPTRDDLFYYEIGGAQAVSPPASRFSSIPVRGSLELGLRYSCGNFDPILGIATQLEQVIDRIETLVLNAITASIAALPMCILERANPGLYDLLQNLLIKADGVIDMANVTCEQMEREIAEGQNPYERWRQLAKGYRWKVNMGNQGWQSSDKDVKSALDDVEQVGGDDGILWVAGERAGGVGQPPIKVIGDVAVAGYNLLLGCPAGDTSTPAALDPQHRIVEIWKTPGELRAWVNQVLGEVSIHTNEAPPDAMAGTGLLKRVQEIHDEVLTNVTALVSGPPSDLTVERLGEVSAGGLALTRAAIEAVQAMAPIERDIVLQKLAAEIALARAVEEGLLARRAFLAGRHEPHVAGSPAFEENQIMDRTLAELNREIDDLVFEARIRREVVSDTLGSVLRLEEARRLQSARTSETPVRDPNPVEGGAVKP